MVLFLITSHVEVRRLLVERHLKEGDAYFNEDIQRCSEGGAYFRPGAYLRKHGIWLLVKIVSSGGLEV